MINRDNVAPDRSSDPIHWLALARVAHPMLPPNSLTGMNTDHILHGIGSSLSASKGSRLTSRAVATWWSGATTIRGRGWESKEYLRGMGQENGQRIKPSSNLATRSSQREEGRRWASS